MVIDSQTSQISSLKLQIDELQREMRSKEDSYERQMREGEREREELEETVQDLNLKTRKL